MEIKYYCNDSGNSPVLRYMKRLTDKRQMSLIFDDISLLADFGSDRLSQTADIEKIAGAKNLWELRTRCVNNIIYRTLFAIIGEEIIILNIFNKKERKLKKREIDLALKRLNKSN